MYYLSKEGRDWIGSDHEVKWTLQLEHYLMRNDLYIYYGCPKDWAVEKKTYFKVLGNNERWIIPDARFQVCDVWHYVEIDRIQTMPANKKKISDYAELSSIIQADLGYKPKIIFYTVKTSREGKLRELCQEAGLDCTIYTQEDLH